MTPFIEIWQASRKEKYLYTTLKSLAEVLRKEYGWCMTYQKQSNVYAWQFILPNNRIEFYRRIFELKKAENPDIANQRVTRTHKGKFIARDTDSPRVEVMIPSPKTRGVLKA